MAFVTDF